VVPRCAARLRDGQPCGRTVLAGSEFCGHHASLVEVHGSDTLKQGLPRRRASAGTAPPKVITGSEPDDAALATENGSKDPATIRPRLAEAAAEGLEGIRKTLLDAATGAVRDHWITFECGECGSRKRIEVPVPDVRARVAAIELLLKEGLGRPPQAEEPRVSRVPDSVEAIHKMAWNEMQALFAAIYVHEIAAIRDRGGDLLVREKLALLSGAQRKLLRRVLAEPALAY
jgi:hypothetical protein